MSKHSNEKPTQDWTPVTIGKPKSVEQQLKAGTLVKDIKEKQGAAKNTQTVSDINARKLEQEEIGHHKVPSHSLQIQIQQARTAKKLTQDQLNTLCCFPKGTVASYENGKAIINSQQLQTMSKHLGVTLKKNT